MELAPAKTEMTIISSLKQPPSHISIDVRGTAVPYSRSIKHLGVLVHDNLSWLPHVTAVTQRADQIAQAVGRLMPNHRGPKMSKSRLLAAVADSVMRYAAPVWHEALNTRECRRLLERVQRKSAIAVARTFRTVRYETTVLLAGLLPICRAIREDTRVHSRRGTGSSAQLRKEERDRTIAEWQATWNSNAASHQASGYIRWAHRLIPDIGAWQSRKHGEVNFHLSLIITGHGFFREYLADMKFTSSPDCTHCPGVRESAEHAMFSCPRFADVRERLMNGVNPNTLLAHMLESQQNWSNVCEAAQQITSVLQREWDNFRTSLFEQGVLADNAQLRNADVLRQERLQRYNDNRNAVRRAATQQRQAECPAPPPPSPRTERRREVNRLAVARLRERQRAARAEMHGTHRPAPLTDSDNDDDVGNRQVADAAPPSEAVRMAAEVPRVGLTEAEAAAAVEAELSSR